MKPRIPSITFTGRWEDRSDDGLGHMCDYGIEHWNKNKDLIIEFNLFNNKEADYVREFMKKSPETPYYINRVC